MPGLTQRDWENALDSQSAPNFGALVTSFNDTIGRMRSEPDYSGTDYISRHPISVLYVTQLLWLSVGGVLPNPIEGCGYLSYSEAHSICLQKAGRS